MHRPLCQHSHARAASIRTPLKQMLAERSLYRKLLFTSEILIYVRKTLSASSLSLSLSLCLSLEREKERDRQRERRVCISRKSAASSSSGGWQPRTSARTCKSVRQRSSIDIQFLRSANKSLSHVHVHLLLLLLDVSVVYCKRKRNILWNVRVFRGIIEALKQQPRPI